MAEEKMVGIMREYVKAVATGDVEKATSYLTEDAVWIMPNGTAKGKEATKSYLIAMCRNCKNMKLIETGNGIIVQGDKAFFEHIFSGEFQGKKFEVLAMCAYEFSSDKIKNIRSVFDRLLLAHQSAKGWPARPIVNMMVGQMEKATK